MLGSKRIVVPDRCGRGPLKAVFVPSASSPEGLRIGPEFSHGEGASRAFRGRTIGLAYPGVNAATRPCQNPPGSCYLARFQRARRGPMRHAAPAHWDIRRALGCHSWRPRYRPIDPMTRRLALFDLDVTLADSQYWFLGVFDQVADRFGYRRLAPGDRERLRGLETRAILQDLGLPTWKLPMIARHLRELAARDIE